MHLRILFETVDQSGSEHFLVAANRIHTDVPEIVRGHAQTNPAANIRRPCFELLVTLRPGESRVGDDIDHTPAEH